MNTEFDDFEYFAATDDRPASGSVATVVSQDGFVDAMTRTEVGMAGGCFVYGLRVLNAKDRQEGIRCLDAFLARRTESPVSGEGDVSDEEFLQRMAVFDPTQVG